jgi:hypothetical protein
MFVRTSLQKDMSISTHYFKPFHTFPVCYSVLTLFECFGRSHSQRQDAARLFSWTHCYGGWQILLRHAGNGSLNNMSACMRVCAFVCVYMYIHVCVYMYMHMYVHMHMYMYMYVNMHMYMYICICICICICVCVCVCVCICMCICICICTCICICMHTETIG